MCLKKEDIKESDADLDDGDCDVEGEIGDLKTVYLWPHDSKHGSWVTCAAEVKDFEQLVGPNHSHPVSVQPLDCFFLLLLLIFFTHSATETNRYTQLEITS